MKGLALGRWGLAGGMAVGIAVLGLLVGGSLSGAQHNARVAAQLSSLAEAERNLGESALKLRYGLTHNYDDINAVMTRMRHARNALENGDTALPGSAGKELDGAFANFAKALDEHEEIVERFKSDNAVLKNSLQHFSPAAAALLHRLPGDSRYLALREELNLLIPTVLRHGLGGEDALNGEIATRVKRLGKLDPGLPPDLRILAGNVAAHAQIIAQYRAVVDREIQHIVFPRIAAAIGSLVGEANGTAQAREQRAEKFHFALGLLAALLLLAVAGAIRRLMKNAREIAASHRFLEQISDNIGEGVFATDKQGRLIFANHEALRLVGWDRDELLGKNLHDTFHAHSAGGGDDTCFTRRDGSIFPVALVDVPLAEEGEIGAVTVFRDMSEARERDKELRLAATVFESSPYGISVTDRAARILDVNPAFTAITGYSAEEVIGENPRLLQSGIQSADFYRKMWQSLEQHGFWKGEMRNRRKNGEIFPEWMHIRAVRDGNGEISHYVGIFSDITEHEQAARQLDYLSNYDTLTGLPNRVLFQDRLIRAIEHPQRQESLLAVLFLDLDHFQAINDTLGHSVGDRLLQGVAQRLQACVGPNATLSRLSGDQFGILFDDIASIAEIAGKSRDLLETLAAPFPVEEHEIYTSACIGVTLYPLDGEDAETLLINADAAMFRAKESSHNTLQFFSADMTEGALDSMRLENALRQALKKGELSLDYQPQVDLKRRRIVGLEALLRWHSPEFGTVSPARFIPVAEKTGLIVPIGAWVLATACKQNKAWQEAGLPPMRVAVNLSAMQFRNGDLIETVRTALTESNLEGRWLELEITESLLMDDVEDTIAILTVLRKLGCEIAIDDFGTGYSSLSYLKRFPVDTLKIDQSFVRGLGHDADDSAVVNAVIGLGEGLGLKLVAEGVENAEQLAALEMRSDAITVQGYHFFRPASAAKIAVCVMAAQSNGGEDLRRSPLP
ncbi:MAG: EAL domain-containing protein [Sulfuricella sp.]|nr:EAL domain-containing protein [Sulfuricella sp.]